jgi:5-methylcytosine-specific restriction endonuclease McrA
MSQLNTKVLVLNRSYFPIGFCAVRDAFKYIAEEIADILDENLQAYDYESWCAIEVEDGDDFVGTVKGNIRAPRIVRLKDFNKVPNTVVRFNRKNLYVRDRYICQYCAKKFPTGMLSMEHVLPKSRGGKTNWNNVVTGCIICNARKGNRTPEEAKMRLLRTPYVPRHMDLHSPFLEEKRYKEWDAFFKVSAPV